MPKSFDKTKQLNLPVSFEVREVDGKQGVVKGYASVFNVKDSYGTVIKPGAFKESLEKKGAGAIRVLWNHNWNEVIGVCQVAREDEIGLYVEFKIVEGVQRSEEVFRLISAGAVDAFSIGFVVLADEYDRENDVINITKVELWEFSPVTFPANKLALVTDVRSMVVESEDEDSNEGEEGLDEDLVATLSELETLNQAFALDELKRFNGQFS